MAFVGNDAAFRKTKTFPNMKVISNRSTKTRARRSMTPRTSRRVRTTRGLQPRMASLPKPAAQRRKGRALKSPAVLPAAGPEAGVARPVLRKHDIPEIWTRYARTGPGSSVESEIVERYLPLVKTVVGRLAMTLPSHAATEDLYSAGLVGLLNAVRRFNPSTGVLFETYARVRIRGAVFDELRRLDWVPRSVHDKARKVETVMRKLEQKIGRLPTSNEMAAALDMSEEDYEHLLNQIRPATFVCLDSVRSAEQEGEATQHEAVADASQPDPGYATARREMAKVVLKRLQCLPEVQRKVIALYYFEDLRLREIAEVFGVTESRISQIHAAAVLSIRGYLDKHDTIREAA
ncbi:MAG: polymerase sigma factor FliA [Verrucomicrobiota bacterium]|jgi:RNA polymerase sigma factor for flagellar operon FliA